MANEVDLSKIKPINWTRVWERLARIFNAQPIKFVLASAADLYGAIFKNAQLTHANFSKSWSSSKETNLSGVNFDGSTFWDVDFSDALLNGSSFVGAKLAYDHCDRVYFIRAAFKNTSIVSSSFREAHFELTKFENVTFQEYSPHPSLEDDPFYKTVFFGVDLSKTDLSMDVLEKSILCNVTIPDGKTVSRNCPDPESLKKAIYR
jgi:uncharacterized protein YjbI with pentapeptide repeats